MNLDNVRTFTILVIQLIQITPSNTLKPHQHDRQL